MVSAAELSRPLISCENTTSGSPPAWRLGVGLYTIHRKDKLVTKDSKEARIWASSELEAVH
jgi:hypothetical protein